MNNVKKVIYIAGYGRSGSTLLERILNTHVNIFGVGELVNFLDKINDRNAFCSCGKLIKQCEFWVKTIKDTNNIKKRSYKLRKIQRHVESLFSLPIPKYLKNYKNYIQNLFEVISKNLPNDVIYIVDSSKTARKCFFRPVLLSKIASLNLRVIHLIRDGRGCMWSYFKGSNRKLEKGDASKVPFPLIRTTFNWMLANIGAHLYQLLYPSNYLRVKYEDLVSSPTLILQQLGNFLEIDFTNQVKLIKKQEYIPLTHQISGNRIRMQYKIILKLDDEWTMKLPIHCRLLFWMINWPLMILYGYK